jgi:AP-1-like factor
MSSDSRDARNKTGQPSAHSGSERRSMSERSVFGPPCDPQLGLTVLQLEDQLAAMEAKHDQTQSENDNLKEMLRRLQTENVLLKQAAFTFSVPRAGDST